MWGDEQLHITVGRAGFWDHRGGNDFQSTTTYQAVKSLLQAGDETGLREVFGQVGGIFDNRSPHQVGGGRLSLTFPDGWRPIRGEAHINRGLIAVVVQHAQGDVVTLTIRQSVESELAWIDLPDELAATAINLRPSWDWTEATMIGLGCEAPDRWQTQDDAIEEQGFVQTLPEDAPLAVVAQRSTANRITVATALI